MEDITYVDEVKQCKFVGTHLISVDRLKPSRYQARHDAFDDVGDIEILAESIQSVGLIEIPSVRKTTDEKDATFEVITGHRRIRAVSQYLGWKQIKCKVYVDVDETTAFCLALTENIHRSNLSPYEEGISYLTCQRIFGLSDSQIAEQLHRSIATVVLRKQFAKLANNCLKYLNESDARPFLQNYTLGHFELLAQVKDIPKIREIISLIKDGIKVKELKLVIEHSKPEPAGKEGSTTSSRIRGRSKRAQLMNQLNSEIERLKEEAPDGFRSKIYLLEDMIDEINSWDRWAYHADASIFSSQTRKEEEEKPRKFACPSCGKTLEVVRQLNEKDSSVLFIVHTPSDKTKSPASIVEFPRIL